jgi:hypothetical protein
MKIKNKKLCLDDRICYIIRAQINSAYISKDIQFILFEKTGV